MRGSGGSSICSFTPILTNNRGGFFIWVLWVYPYKGTLTVPLYGLCTVYSVNLYTPFVYRSTQMNQVNLSLHIGYTSLGFLDTRYHSCDQFAKSNKSALKCRETDISVLPCWWRIFNVKVWPFSRRHCISSHTSKQSFYSFI